MLTHVNDVNFKKRTQWTAAVTRREEKKFMEMEKRENIMTMKYSTLSSN